MQNNKQGPTLTCVTVKQRKQPNMSLKMRLKQQYKRLHSSLQVRLYINGAKDSTRGWKYAEKKTMAYVDM